MILYITLDSTSYFTHNTIFSHVTLLSHNNIYYLFTYNIHSYPILLFSLDNIFLFSFS